MSQVDSKYKLTDKILRTPYGDYYYAVDNISELNDSPNSIHTDNNYLILVLTINGNELAWANLDNIKESISGYLAEYNEVFWPILEIYDSSQGIMVVMPYLDGKPLANILPDYNITDDNDSSSGVSPSKPETIGTIVSQFLPLADHLSTIHELGNSHGFINFTTIWLTKGGRLALIGCGFFNVLLDKVNLKSYNYLDTNITSCYSNDNLTGTINMSPATDYYSCLVITCSLLNGYLPSSNLLKFDYYESYSGKVKKLLSPEYYRNAYQGNQSLLTWFLRLKAANQWTIFNKAAVYLTLFLMLGFTAASYKHYFTNNFIYKNTAHYINKSKNKVVALFAFGSNNLKSDSNNKSNTDKKERNLKQISRAGSLPIIAVNKSNKATSQVKDNIEPQNTSKISPNNAGNQNNHINKLENKEVPELVKKTEATEEIKNKNTIEQKITYIDNLMCKGSVCQEIILGKLKGPKLTKVNIENNDTYLMPESLSQKDYLTFCLIAGGCNKNIQNYKVEVLQCIFEDICNKDATEQLSKHVDSIDISTYKNYINWINKVSSGGYSFLTDKQWLFLISYSQPEQDCQPYSSLFADDTTFANYSLPELVKYDDQTLFLRSPLKIVETKEVDDSPYKQCQSYIITNDDYKNKFIARLTKKVIISRQKKEPVNDSKA